MEIRQDNFPSGKRINLVLEQKNRTSNKRSENTSVKNQEEVVVAGLEASNGPSLALLEFSGLSH